MPLPSEGFRSLQSPVIECGEFLDASGQVYGGQLLTPAAENLQPVRRRVVSGLYSAGMNGDDLVQPRPQVSTEFLITDVGRGGFTHLLHESQAKKRGQFTDNPSEGSLPQRGL